MKRPVTPRVMLVALALVVVAAACGGSKSDSDAGLTLTLTADGTDVTATLTNSGSETVRVVRPTVSPNFVSFVVTDAAGAELPFVGPYLQLRPLGDDGFADLEPGDSTAAVFDLTEYFDLGSGSFEVRAEYRNSAAGSHEGSSALVFESGEGIESGPVEVVVP